MNLIMDQIDRDQEAVQRGGLVSGIDDKRRVWVTWPGDLPWKAVGFNGSELEPDEAPE